MPTLTLKFKENELGKYVIRKGKSLNIGRLNSNDIVIDNLAVSGIHAKIDSVGDGYLFTDLKSKNGSFVNNQLVISHWLRDGDVIRIGKHNLVFAYEKGEPQFDPRTAGLDQTMVMDTSKYQEMAYKRDQGSPGEEQGDTASASLAFLGGGEGETKLSKKLIKIGKSRSCDIIISGVTAGRTAATISKRPNGYYLSFVGGLAKPKVNGETVKESCKLKEFDIIEIGSAKMQLIFSK